MPILTAIEPQQRRKGRYNLFVDGQFVVGVGELALTSLHLKIGQDINADRLKEIAFAEEMHRALDTALRLLGVRERSKGEIETRLRQAGYPDEVIDPVAAKLSEMDLINDSRFAAAWVQSKTRDGASRPVGRRRLMNELSQKGLAPQVIQTALVSVDEEQEMDLARAAGSKKVRSIPADYETLQAERHKLLSFLQRRGFQWDVCKRITVELLPGVTKDLGDDENE